MQTQSVTATKIIMSDPTALGVFGLAMVTLVAASSIKKAAAAVKAK